MRNSKSIKFIYFDLGGVLFDWQTSLDSLSKIFKTEPEKFIPIWNKYDELVIRGVNDVQQIWTNLKKDFKYRGGDIKLLKSWVNGFTPYLQMHNLIEKLSQKYPIGLLTNIYPGTLDLAIKKGSVPDLNYTVLIESYKTSYVKPEKEIFEIAEKKSGVKPKEIFFIDDSEINIKAASKRGWQTHLFDIKTSITTISDWAPLL